MRQQLQQIKRASGWSQEQLARELGVSLRAVQAWLSGEAQPHPDKQTAIVALARRVLGAEAVDVRELAQAEKLVVQAHFDYRELINNPELRQVLTENLTYHTNAIEGSTLSLPEVQTILADVEAILPDKSLREQMEARNHAAALRYALAQLAAGGGQIVWSTELICALHVRLMNGIMAGAGRWRQYRVRIAGSFVPLANYLVVPREMQLLMADLNQSEGTLEELAQLHARFEQIHPFGDGNGRTGRLVLLLQALQAGWYPPLIKREYRLAYYQALERAQIERDGRALRLCLAQAMVETQRLLGE